MVKRKYYAIVVKHLKELQSSTNFVVVANKSTTAVLNVKGMTGRTVTTKNVKNFKLRLSPRLRLLKEENE